MRRLLLLELQNVAGDLFAGFVALYFAGVEDAGARIAALAVAVWAAADLTGNMVLVRVLDRLDGLRCLRFTAAAAAVVLPAFLLVPGVGPKLVALALFAALRSCWYPLAQARLYAALPGRSGAVSALSTLASPIGIAAPLLLGALAASLGLGNALWAVLVAPLAVLAGTPGVQG